MSKPETPLLTVDAVILYEKNKIVLIRRKNPPFQGEHALPGGFVDIGETVENACVREAKEETNLDVQIKKLIGVFSEPNRDPRGHTVSVAFLCTPVRKTQNPKAQDDASSLDIVPINQISKMKLAFDHKEILRKSGILN
ncbi:MAG: NUDIX hydrolase [Candidatus Lokiarchaeota archaeon]